MERVEPRPGVDCEVGSVIQINHETAEGVIYLEDNNLQLPFHLSKIKHLDKRFLNDIVIGVQFYCKVSTDCKGVHKIQEVSFLVILRVQKRSTLREIRVPFWCTSVKKKSRVFPPHYRIGSLRSAVGEKTQSTQALNGTNLAHALVSDACS